MKLLFSLSCLVILCYTAEGATSVPKDCVLADHRLLKHGESGPAALGQCELVECRNGWLSTTMHCGLVQLGPNCPVGVETRDFTKLYPDCCVPNC